jgi:hypothetical protein
MSDGKKWTRDEWIESMQRGITIGLALEDAGGSWSRDLNYIDLALQKLKRQTMTMPGDAPTDSDPEPPLQETLIGESALTYSGRPCAACGMPIVWKPDSKVPFDVRGDGTLGGSHFATCSDPKRFSSKAKRKSA